MTLRLRETSIKMNIKKMADKEKCSSRVLAVSMPMVEHPLSPGAEWRRSPGVNPRTRDLGAQTGPNNLNPSHPLLLHPPQSSRRTIFISVITSTWPGSYFPFPRQKPFAPVWNHWRARILTLRPEPPSTTLTPWRSSFFSKYFAHSYTEGNCCKT